MFTNAPVEKDAVYQVSLAPGHGVDVNEEAAKQQTFEYWEAPRMKKPDGSFTNW